MNQFQSYEKKTVEALKLIGFDAEWSDARTGNNFVVKGLTRIGLLQKIKSLSKATVARIVRDALAIDADTVLLISPETMRGPEIAQLRHALPNTRVLLYLWDSAVNRHLDQDMIDLVDSAFSFDLNDCESFMNLRFLPLFHQHTEFKPPDAPRAEPEFDYCFIGTARLRRIKVLAGIGQQARQNKAPYYFFLFAPSALQFIVFWLYAKYVGFDGTLSRESIPYQTYLDMLGKSGCVIDVEQGGQGGLTIRTMDTVFAGRPLATTNPNIEAHDFFPHFPISVFSETSLDVTVPHPGDGKQPQAYFDKYHISNWLETILKGQPESYRLSDEHKHPREKVTDAG